MTPYYERPTYWNFIRSEAEAHQSDGCTAVMGFHVECCFEHDLGYRFAKDPRDAYFRFRGGSLDPWKNAKPITREEVDRRFRRCHQNRSRFGQYSPMAWWRWAGVRLRGGPRWNFYRLTAQQERV